MRAVLALCLVSTLSLLGCKKQREGLPPAEEWGVNAELGSADMGTGAPGAPGMAGGANPHGDGMAFGTGGNPHGTTNPGDPHAGMNMGGMGGDPHAGVDMSGGGGPDVTQVLPPPDPNRKLDPNRRITGTLKLDPKLKGRVKPSSTIFVFAKRAGANGEPTGFPLASEKIAWTDAAQIAFALTDEDLMSGAAEFTGDVVLMARVDQDHDASSRQPGDVTGQVRVKIPADNVAVTLDSVLP